MARSTASIANFPACAGAYAFQLLISPLRLCRVVKLTCTACWIAESQRMTGTREDVTCDYCRQYQPPPPAGGTRMRAIQSAPFTERGLIVVFGLCPPCWEADQAGIPI